MLKSFFKTVNFSLKGEKVIQFQNFKAIMLKVFTRQRVTGVQLYCPHTPFISTTNRRTSTGALDNIFIEEMLKLLHLTQREQTFLTGVPQTSLHPPQAPLQSFLLNLLSGPYSVLHAQSPPPLSPSCPVLPA